MFKGLFIIYVLLTPNDEFIVYHCVQDYYEESNTHTIKNPNGLIVKTVGVECFSA